MMDLVLYDIDDKKFGFDIVSYDLKKHKDMFPYLKPSIIFINNRETPVLYHINGTYIFYNNVWYRYILYTLLRDEYKLWTAPIIGRRLATLNKFFDEGELA